MSKPRIAVAGLSARMMAEAAAREGFEVLALDLFGDLDTQRAASAGWRCIGDPAQMRLDPALTLAALKDAAGVGNFVGWVAGSGFEAQAELLADASVVLPLLGTAASDVARLRNPIDFFSGLEARGVAHPLIAPTLTNPSGSWLLKDAWGCGGWHVERVKAGATLPTDHHYFQQELIGQPMSATFIGNGSEARVLGFNEMIVRPIGRRPFVFHGVIGPVPFPAIAGDTLAGIIQDLTADYQLRGLCSLDFIRTGESSFSILEVNARPSASMALYLSAMRAHVDACVDRRLPVAAPQAEELTGTEIVFARRPGLIDEKLAQALAGRPDVHDLPHAGTRFTAGDPVCSLSSAGRTAAEVRDRLDAAKETLLNTLETPA